MNDPRAELANPSTPPARLAELTQQHPELASLIAAHPNCYPELRDWINQYANSAGSGAGGSQPEGSGSAQPTTVLPDPARSKQPEQTSSPEPQPDRSLQSMPAPQGMPEPADMPAPQGMPAPTGMPAPQGLPAPQNAQQVPGQPPQGFPTTQMPQETTPLQQYTQPTMPLQPGMGAPGSPVPPGFGAPAGSGGPKKSRKGLWITLSIVLVVLLAGGGVFWFMFGSKLGGAKSPEAAAQKLIESVTDVDPVSLYGSLAPSEFDVFEQATKTLMSTEPDKDSKTVEQFISDLGGKVKTKTVEPLETEVDEIVDGEISRVTVTDGVIEIDGDPDEIAEVVTEFVYPIIEASAPYDMPSKKEAESEMRSSLKDNLPLEIDFREQFDGELSFVSVKEGSNWYVSPLMTAADYVHKGSGQSDSLLGDEILEPSKAAGSADAAAEELTNAIFDGDYDSIVKQMPLAERRVLSIYGDSFMESAGANPADLPRIMKDAGVTLGETKFSAKEDGSSARVNVDKIEVTGEQEDYYSGEKYEYSMVLEGTCVTYSSDMPTRIDYFDDDALFEKYLKQDKYYSFDDWLEAEGYPLYETEKQSEKRCLEDMPEASTMIDALGIDEWALVAVKEDGGWRISPLGTIADISSIISNKVNEAAKKGELDSLFDA